MKTLLFAVSLLLFSCENNDKPDFKIQLNAVKTAFKHKEIDSLRPFLANGYTVKGLPEGLEPMVLKELIKKMPAPEKFMIKSEAPEKRGTRITADFYYEDNVVKNYNFLIAKDGKLLELNILGDAQIETIEN